MEENEEYFSSEKYVDESEEDYEWRVLGEYVAMLVREAFEIACENCDRKTDCLLFPLCHCAVYIERGWEGDTWVWEAEAELYDPEKEETAKEDNENDL